MKAERWYKKRNKRGVYTGMYTRCALKVKGGKKVFLMILPGLPDDFIKSSQ
jgi:hypothetical protein